jgi:hypothetical protein
VKIIEINDWRAQRAEIIAPQRSSDRIAKLEQKRSAAALDHDELRSDLENLLRELDALITDKQQKASPSWPPRSLL